MTAQVPGAPLFIVDRLLTEYNKIFNRTLVLRDQIKPFIESYDWPRDVRDLGIYIGHLVVTAKESVITAETASRILGTVQKKPRFCRRG